MRLRVHGHPIGSQVFGQAKRIGALLVFALSIWPALGNAEVASIELTDGSTLRGEVVSLKGGAYQIKTTSLGVVNVPQSDVALVRYGATPKVTGAATTSGAGSSAPANAGMDVAQLQSMLSQNPETMSLIQGLGQDPVIQDVLNDADLQAAIARGDIQTLMAHPKMQKLMQHPTIRKITRQSGAAQ